MGPIYLIRHGETPGNRERRVQVPETPLSDRGLEQARRLGARMRDVGLLRLLSSDLARARMTAEAVAAAAGLEAELDPVYQERNFGDLRGTLYAELESDLFGPDFEPPGGESWGTFYDRVDLAWARARELALASEGPIAVVTHGLVCHGVLARHCEGGVSGGAVTPMGNTAVSVLRPGARGTTRWLADPIGCTTHLDAAHAADLSGPTGI